jgi:cell fate (sporulation/competence/biofilm development) regulator YmcA (YheA/YmcA/DUF963 family)
MKLNRSQLAQVFTNHETLRAFEQALQDVNETLPSATSDVQAIATDASQRATNVGGDVARLLGVVGALEALAYSKRDEAATIRRLEGRIADLEVIIQQRHSESTVQRLQSRVAELESQIIALSRAVNLDRMQKQINDLQTLLQAS